MSDEHYDHNIAELHSERVQFLSAYVQASQPDVRPLLSIITNSASTTAKHVYNV